MKKLIIALMLMVFTLPVPLAMARDANRDSLGSTWKAQEAQQKKEADKAKAEATKGKAANPEKSVR